MNNLLSALAQEKEIHQLLSGKKIAVFLDYDGTLTPIVARPDLAVLSEEMRATLKLLSRACPVGIISGRARDDVESLVKIPHLYYAGSHGFDIKGPNLSMTPAGLTPLLPAIDKAYQSLIKKTEGIEGCLLEFKKYALAVHYRLVDPAQVPKIEAMADSLVEKDSRLRKTTGKKVFEIRVNYPWDKGKALLFFLKALHLSDSQVLPFYLGDDDTDEDAFNVLERRGIGILVSDSPRKSAASYSLKNIPEVKLFLEKLTAWLRVKKS